MIFGAFLSSENESNMFVVGCEDTHDAMIIDAGDFSGEMAAFIEEKKLNVKAIFITHDHYDHTGGVAAMVARYGAGVLSANGKAGGKHGVKVVHDQEIAVGNLAATVCATPGHTPDSLCLVFPGMVFTGDALFAGSIGGTMSEENKQQEIRGIRTYVFSLPEHYELHTGHGPSSTVGIERSSNPFFVVK
jgi:glyoxylase-like metal-dependent hydrolase (beta-lactamase superfamily II)